VLITAIGVSLFLENAASWYSARIRNRSGTDHRRCDSIPQCFGPLANLTITPSGSGDRHDAFVAGLLRFIVLKTKLGMQCGRCRSTRGGFADGNQ